MGFIGDFAKSILILTVAFWIFIIFEFFAMGQTGIGLLLFVVLLVPLSMIMFEYRKYKKV